MSHRLYQVPDFYFNEFNNFYEFSGFYNCIILDKKTNEVTGNVEAKVAVVNSEMTALIPMDLLEKHALPESI